MTDVALEPRSFAVERGESAEHGAVLFVPLNRLKKSPRNVRKTDHSAEDIAALAASIAAKKGVQPTHPLVVEPELDGDQPTGFYLVTAGEGRRLGLGLLAKQKAIKKTHPVRCVLDTENDPAEVSLDENVTRAPMHPADQFAAFKDQQDRRGLSAEEIAARFGVRPQVVRQRLRLGAASPLLMEAYRGGTITLDQLMAYCLTDDPERQAQVFANLGPSAQAYAIRRVITAEKVPASDRRVQFVGLEAYAAAGGPVLRDLFTEAGDGWAEDAGLLDRLVLDKLRAQAESVRAEEGWKWAEAFVDYPHGHGFGRVYPGPLILSDEQRAEITRLTDEQDALANQWEASDDLPPEVAERFSRITAELDALQAETYASDDLARAGVIVVLSYNGESRVDRGLVRSEDELAEPEAPGDDHDHDHDHDLDDDGEAAATPAEEEADDGLSPLPDRLVADLTARRTLALRVTLARQSILALAAVVHALALRVFYPAHDQPTCLAVRLESASLDDFAPGSGETADGRVMAEAFDAWAQRLPKEAKDAWGFIAGLDADAMLDLLAFLAGSSVNAVRSGFERRPGAWAHADAVALAAGLDMREHWSATADTYLGRVTKARILEAVVEGVSADAAKRLADLKKADMAQAAEAALKDKGWLPPLLRAPAAAPAAAPLAAE
jgi:ParB family chromosome partitioning protein